MRRDRLFRDSAPQDSGFKFDAKVAAVFDDMITRSVPFYVEQQRMVAEIVKQHWQPDTNIYDLGCATGTTLVNLSREVSGSGRLIGYDNSVSMLEQARCAIAAHGLAERISLGEQCRSRPRFYRLSLRVQSPHGLFGDRDPQKARGFGKRARAISRQREQEAVL